MSPPADPAGDRARDGRRDIAGPGSRYVSNSLPGGIRRSVTSFPATCLSGCVDIWNPELASGPVLRGINTLDFNTEILVGVAYRSAESVTVGRALTGGPWCARHVAPRV